MPNSKYPDTANYSPGILTYIEHHDDAGRLMGWAWEARIYGQSERFPTHDEAAAWCITQKAVRAAPASIAEEMAA
jgi:hypothetical protein